MNESDSNTRWAFWKRLFGNWFGEKNVSNQSSTESAWPDITLVPADTSPVMSAEPVRSVPTARVLVDAPVTSAERMPDKSSVVSSDMARKASDPPANKGSDAVSGGRTTKDFQFDNFMTPFQLLNNFSTDEKWRYMHLDSKTLDRIPVYKLMEYLCDVSPEISKALFDFLTMSNPGYECKAYNIKSDNTADSETINAPAQVELDGFWSLMKNLYGAADVPIARLFISVFLRGEVLSELVFDEDSETVVDFCVVDPRRVTFRRVLDKKRGAIWQLVQWQSGNMVILDAPTITFIPFHPLPGNPRGRPMASSAMFVTLFLVGLLHDLRRVVSQQGYPRLDLELVSEKIFATMPMDVKNDAENTRKWLTDAMNEVAKAYGKLEPDDAYVHLDTVKINKPVGTVDSQSLGYTDKLISALERMAVQALKTMPLLMGINEAVSETHANRQWEIYAQGIKSIQHIVESLLETSLTLMLQQKGIQAKVEMRFAELRAAELLRDAQVETADITNARMLYDNGIISQDEQAQRAAGKAKADQPEPRVTKSAPPVAGMPAIPANADPGSNKSKSARRIQPTGAHLPLLSVPDQVDVTATDIADGTARWNEVLPDFAGLLDAHPV